MAVPPISIPSAVNGIKAFDSSLMYKKVATDTIVKLVKSKGKAAYIQDLDERIEKAKAYVHDNIQNIESEYNVVQLNLISRHFNLGLDTMQLIDSLPYYYYYSLYGLYYRDVSGLSDLDMLNKSGVSLDSIAFDNIYKRSTRIDFTTFCQYFQFRDTTLLSMYIISQENITKKLEIYGLISEVVRKGCSSKSTYLPVLKAKLKTEIINIIEHKAPKDFMDNNSVINPVKAIGYALYAGDINVRNNGDYILYLLKNQSDDGSWHKQLGVNEENSVLATIFGLWALCEVREQCKAL